MKSVQHLKKHSFFYASAFMASLVLGSVLVYSVFLPQTAPKQITLAVMPFTEKDEFTPLSVGLTVAIRDSIALSRDIAVVDAISTNAVIWDDEKRGGMSHILALTHFVDGQLQRVDDEVTSIDIRVINVTQPNWKEVVVTSISVATDSTTPLQDLRDEVTLKVRTSLYDNSLLRTEETTHTPDEYLAYMVQLGNWLLQFKETNALSNLHGAFHTKLREIFKRTGIATGPNQQLWTAIDEFKRSINLRQYVDRVWQLAGEYPNSLAVASLALMAYDLDELKLAEHAALRVARVQPQSAEIALYVGFFRHSLGDQEGVEKAFRIAELRDDRDVVPYFAELAQNMDSSTYVSAEKHEGLQNLATHHLGRIVDDFILTTRIHLGDLETIEPSDLSTDRFWTAPPIWMSQSDSRWQRARVYLKRNFDFVLDEAPSGLLSEATTDEAMQALFAPRRPD